jgi:hypothetical protein
MGTGLGEKFASPESLKVSLHNDFFQRGTRPPSGSLVLRFWQRVTWRGWVLLCYPVWIVGCKYMITGCFAMRCKRSFANCLCVLVRAAKGGMRKNIVGQEVYVRFNALS